jgi:hypothetical protein
MHDWNHAPRQGRERVEDDDDVPLVAMKAETVHSLYFSTPRRYLRSVSAGL